MDSRLIAFAPIEMAFTKNAKEWIKLQNMPTYEKETVARIVYDL